MTTRAQRGTARRKRVPGIIFADGPTGRRARLAGTGIEVFEVLRAFHQFGDSRAELVEELDWLTAAQIAAALTYYAAFPDEIDGLLAVEAALIPDDVKATLPSRRPDDVDALLTRQRGDPVGQVFVDADLHAVRSSLAGFRPAPARGCGAR